MNDFITTTTLYEKAYKEIKELTMDATEHGTKDKSIIPTPFDVMIIYLFVYSAYAIIFLMETRFTKIRINYNKK